MKRTVYTEFVYFGNYLYGLLTVTVYLREGDRGLSSSSQFEPGPAAKRNIPGPSFQPCGRFHPILSFHSHQKKQDHKSGSVIPTRPRKHLLG